MAYVGAFLKANGDPTLYPLDPMRPWHPDEFTNVNLAYFPGPPIFVSVTWDTDLGHLTWGIAYAAATWKSDEIVYASRWRFYTIVDSSSGTVNFAFDFPAPYYHVRIDWLHDNTNVVYRQTIFRQQA
jgi:hypothetical protein